MEGRGGAGRIIITGQVPGWGQVQRQAGNNQRRSIHQQCPSSFPCNPKHLNVQNNLRTQHKPRWCHSLDQHALQLALHLCNNRAGLGRRRRQRGAHRCQRLQGWHKRELFRVEAQAAEALQRPVWGARPPAPAGRGYKASVPLLRHLAAKGAACASNAR